MSIEGRKQQLQRNLNRIVQTLVARYSPESILLFGSMSTENLHQWSDIDLVIIKETAKPFYERLREVAALCNPDVSVHYFVYTPEEFRHLRESGNFFVNREMVDKGKSLYERA